jgi:hypothetical protein
MTILTKPSDIEAFRLLSIKGRLSLELKGLRFRINTFAAVKREFGFKGNNQKVYDQYIAVLKERGILEVDS